MRPVPLLVAALVLSSGCAGFGGSSLDRADVAMHDAAGRDLGTLVLTNGVGGLMLAGVLRGLPPGAHGIHRHTVALCEPPFTSAGGHWNPTSHQHGTQNPQGPHLGDLPNISVSTDSVATVSVMSSGGSLHG